MNTRYAIGFSAALITCSRAGLATLSSKLFYVLIGLWLALGPTAPAQALPFAYISGTASGGNGIVLALDTASNTVAATIPAGQPGSVTVNRTGTRAYVVNVGENTVSAINTITKTVVAIIPVGDLSYGGIMTLNIRGTRGYVSNFRDGTISVIDTTSNTVIATIPVNPGGRVDHLTLNPTETRAYVLAHDSDRSSSVAVINTTTNKVVARMPIYGEASGITVNLSGSRVYVPYSIYNQGVDAYNSYVAVINTASNSIITSVAVGTGAHVSGPVKINPAGTRLYGVTSGEDVFIGGIYVVNIVNNSLIKNEALGFGFLQDLILNASGKRAYMTLANPSMSYHCGSEMIVFDTVNNTVIKRVYKETNLSQLALHPHGTRIYATNDSNVCSFDDSGIAVFNTTTNTFTTTLPIVHHPVDVAMGPPTRLRFSNAAYAVGEGAGKVVITVRRVGGVAGATSVHYSTANGTAVAGSDYTAKSGRLTWGNGDSTPKTFAVPIVNDSAVEPNETVRLILSAPTGGATLGNPKAATLTIINND